MRREMGVLGVGKRARRFEDTEIFFKLRSSLGCGEGHRDRWVLKDEAVPLRRAGHDEPEWIVRRWLQQRAPSQGGVGDDRQAKRLGDRKEVLLRTAVGRVVTDHH